MYKIENIKISNKLYINRTATYLLPLMKAYDDEFAKLFTRVVSNPIAFGIDDHKGPHYENCLYSLFIPNENFHLIEKMEEYPQFKDHYVFNDSKYHMLVVELPRDVMGNFLEGNYSMLLSKDEIEKFYKKKIRKNRRDKYTKVYSTVTKLPARKIEFIEELLEDFGHAPHDSEIHEYDYPPILNQEIFNYD
jgi:hypothetical protein